MATTRQRSPPPALARIRFVTRLLDTAVRVPGTRFRVGLDPILGILPVAGDTVSTLISVYVVFEAVRLGVPRDVIAKMLAVLAADWVIGAIPLLGPPIDAVFKANKRNLALVESALERQYRTTEPV